MSESAYAPLPSTTAKPEARPLPPRHAAPVQIADKEVLDAVVRRHSPPSAPLEHARLALGYVERSAREGLTQLEALTAANQTPRDGLIVKIAVELGHATEDLASKLAALSEKELASLRKPANAAAEAVLRVRAWVRSRAPNASMVQAVELLIHDLDPALLRIGVVPVGQRSTPPLRDDESREATDEVQAVTLAAANLREAIDLEHDQTITGIAKFCQDQMAEDDDDVSFVEAVAKSLVIAVVGNVIGEQVGGLLGRLAKRSQRTLGEKATDRISNITTDYVQGFSGELVAARQASEKVRANKARTYFATALQSSAHWSAFEQKRSVNSLVAAGGAVPSALNAESLAKTTHAQGLATTYADVAAQLWATYQSQSSLGTHALRVNGKRVSKMTDYFGEHDETGRVFGTGRQGTHGVARLGFTIDPESGTLAAGRFEIAGSNTVIAEHVASHAGGHLDKIWLPKEVTVSLKQYRAVIAIDETNRVRDSVGWDDVARAFPDHGVLGSPHRFWTHVRGTRV